MKKLLFAVIGAAVIASVVLWYRIDTQKTASLENAVVAFKSGDYEDAFPVLMAFADEGEATAVRLTALAYAYGLGVDANDESARKYFLMLSEDERNSLCEDDVSTFAASDSKPLRDTCKELEESEPQSN